MGTADIIAEKLGTALAPTKLEIIDESSQHAGHVGARPGGETHFRVKIVAATFSGKTRVDRQRLVYQTLAQELAGGVHALALTTLSPEEDAAATS
ncbi:MAG: BolA family transcriptional regulator [Proteobacteria bacterium]|nr:BolA family transcriptional regulator [Pseudomonadota bacterium]